MARYLILLFFFTACYGFANAQKQTAAEKTADSLLDNGQFEAAIKYYDIALKADPNSEMLLRGKAYCYFNLIKMDVAADIYQKALKVNPRCLRCEIFLINILAYKNQYEAALHKADSVLTKYADTGKKYTDYAEIKTQKANIYINMGNTAAAEAVYEELVEDYPDSAGSYYMYAEFNYHFGSKTKALRAVNKAIELNNNAAIYYFLKCKIYIVINYYKEAKDIINIAIKLDSTNGEYYGYRGGICHHFGEIEPAIIDYKNAIKHGAMVGFYGAKLAELYLAKEDMDSMCVYTALSKAALEEDTAGVDYKAQYKTIAQQQEEFCNPDSAGYYYQRGVALYNKGLYDGAIAFYTLGLQKFPKNAVMLNFRGNAYAKTGRWKNAEADYRACLLYPEELLQTSRNRFRLGDVNEADIYAKGFTASNYLGLSEVYLNMGMYTLAKQTGDSALALLPVVIDAPLFTYYNQLGRVFMAMGQYDSAIKEFEKVITLSPKDATGYANMAIATAFRAVQNPDKFIPYGFSSLFGGFQTFGTLKSRPAKLTQKQEVILQDALSYCDRAMGLIDNAGELFFVRAYIKYLAQKTDACADVERTKALGFQEGATYLEVICK